MTTIKLHNTKTRKREEFVPIDPENVRMYLCGPTVYDRAHLGNARPVLVFDVLNRLLRHVFGEDNVTYVRNFTDVDDRINETAQKRKADGAQGTLEELIHERSNETIEWYHADMDALGAARPDHEPRATEYIAQMIAMIEELIAKDHAYEAEGHVLFAVDSWRAHYGKLSGRSVDDMIAGARVEVAPYKRNPMDFVMWKPSPEGLPGWDSPWGKGRPGWHIECSAMARELLGDHFDIHGGGNDLMFPHHENEIAQSCCANGTDEMANVWMHNEMLQVEGKKMSKSLGNFFTVRDLLDQGVPGEVIRFVMLSTHYRKPMDWTEKKREEAEKTLRKMGELLSDVNLNFFRARVGGLKIPAPNEIVEALSNDLNTSLALTLLNGYVKKLDVQQLAPALILLGFDPDELVRKFHSFEFRLSDRSGTDHPVQFSTTSRTWGDVDKGLTDLLNQLGRKFEALRADAMKTKDFSKVDEQKAAFVKAGVEVRMSKEGVELVPLPDFDSTKLEALK